MKKLLLLALALSCSLVSHAQQSTIKDLRVAGLLPQYDEAMKPYVGVLAKVDLQYSRISADEGGCVVLMHNGKLPQVNTAIELIEAAQKYCVACEDLSASSVQKSATMDVFLPMDSRLNGTEKTLYLQAFVLYGEENPKLLAKSNVLTVNPAKLTVIQQDIDPDQVTENIQRDILGGLFMGLMTNPDGVSEDGYKPCPICKGEGQLRDDSYDHAEERESGERRVITVSTCKECNGKGRVKASSTDIELKRKMEGLVKGAGVSEGDLYDMLMGSKKKNKTNTRKK